MIRLDVYLAESQVGTRKLVRELVHKSLVTVNDELVIEPATLINEDTDIIKYNNEIIKTKGKLYYAFNKTAGSITARSDNNHATIMDYFKDVDEGGLFPIGRLDKDTEGLILITNDGQFDHRLMHPDCHVSKTYFFYAAGEISDSDIKELETGISIDNGVSKTKPSKIDITFRGLYDEIKSELDKLPIIKINMKQKDQYIYGGYITITEGKKHQIKRMFKAKGGFIIYLKRVAIGNLKLTNDIKPNTYKALSKEEIDLI